MVAVTRCRLPHYFHNFFPKIVFSSNCPSPFFACIIGKNHKFVNWPYSKVVLCSCSFKRNCNIPNGDEMVAVKGVESPIIFIIFFPKIVYRSNRPTPFFAYVNWIFFENLSIYSNEIIMTAKLFQTQGIYRVRSIIPLKIVSLTTYKY